LKNKHSIELVDTENPGYLLYCRNKIRIKRERANKHSTLAKDKLFGKNVKNYLESLLVDLSHALGFKHEKKEGCPEYVKIRNVKNYLKSLGEPTDEIWVDSKEIIEITLEHNLMSKKKLNKIKSVYKKKQNEDERADKGALARELMKEYEIWESLVRMILGRHIKQVTKRILKYPDPYGKYHYREIDFIAEANGSLSFCEIKHKNYCGLNNNLTDPLKKARVQVEKSHRIAKEKYQLFDPLVVAVDMSYALGLKHEKQEE